MKIDVDRTLCETHAQCVFAAPDVFSLDADDELIFEPDPDPAHDEAVRRAALVCPVQAIKLAGDPA